MEFFYSENYIEAHTMQRREAQDVVEEFSYELSKMKGKCLDIGSGPGDVTKELLLPYLSPDVEIIGADISPKMTDYASLKYVNEPRLSFIVLDIETSKLPDDQIEQYDNAVSFFCLHWCQNISLVFENIYKLLRPGGSAIVNFLSCHSGFESYNVLKEVPQYKAYMKDAYHYIPYFQRNKKVSESRAYLRQILEKTGFTIIHCSNREKSFIYENQQMLKKHVLAINPFVSRMPDDIKDEFIDDVVKEIMKKEILIRNEKKEQEEEKEEYMILDRYHVLFAYVKKPNLTFCRV